MKKISGKDRFISYLLNLVYIYNDMHVARGAAALSYCLTLSIFPTLICIYAILVNIVPGMNIALDDFQGVIPESTLTIVLDYLQYVSTHNNSTMITAGIIGMITTSAASFRTISGIMGDIQGETRHNGLFKLIFSFIYSLIFLASIYFAAIVMVSGNWIMNHLANAFPVLRNFSLWQTFKYPILLVIFILIIYVLYLMTAPKGTRRTVLPGAILAAILMVLASVFFSIFINMSTRYPLIYGSLASIIICMLWLYVFGIILIMCNALNVVVRKQKEEDYEIDKRIREEKLRLEEALKEEKAQELDNEDAKPEAPDESESPVKRQKRMRFK